MAKGKNTFSFLKVDSTASSPFSLINFDCLVLDGYLAISVMDTLDVNNAVRVGGSVAHIRIGKGQLTRLVIVEDSNTNFGIASIELFSSCNVVQLNVEIFIWLPTMVIDNLDLNFL